MLSFLRKRRRSRNVLLVALVFLLSIGLLAFFSVVVSGSKAWLFGGPPSDDSTVARVVSYQINLKELRDALSAFGQRISQGQGPGGAEEPGALYDMYGKQVMDGLVQQKLVLYEADQLGLLATDGEIKEKLKQMFNPWTTYDQYRLRLQQAGYTPERFEEEQAAVISQEKLRSFVTAGVQVSPQDVEDEYRRNNTNYNIRWVTVKPDDLKAKVQVADAELRAYFDQHKQDFHVNSQQRRARYLFVDQKKAGETIQVSDDELKKLFDPERGVLQVRASQIVLHIPKAKPAEANKNSAAAAAASSGEAKQPSPDESVKALADQIVSEAGSPEADFARLVRKYSEDQKTRGAGGDVGWVNKKDKREADDPLSRVFTMKKGEVSPPIRKGEDYYILKVTDRKLPTFEESRGQLLKEERASKSYTRAVEIATEVEQKFKESGNAESVAGEINKKYGVELVKVKETSMFAEGDSLPDLGAATEFESAVFQLSNAGDVAERQNVSNGFAIPQLVEKSEPHDPQFEEVKSKVEDRYRYEKAKGLALDRARELARAQTPDALKTSAESMGLKAEERAGVTGNDPTGPLMTDAAKANVYKLERGHVTPEPIKVDSTDDYAVVGLIDRKDPDMDQAFKKDRKSIEDRLLSTRRDTMLSTFLESTEKRLKDEGKIKIYRDVIDSALASGELLPNKPAGGGQPFSRGSRGPRRAPPRR